MADTFKFVQNQPTSLAGAGALIGDTSITLKSLKTIDGANLAMTDFGSIGYGTLEPGNGTLEEQISFAGITQNANGTATLTTVKSVTFVAPYTETAGLLKTHAGSTSFVISNTAGFYNKISGKDNDETITGIWTFTSPNYPKMDTATPAPVADAEFATKKYVDDVAIAGSPKATEAVFGITELSVAAVDPATPIAVGTNDTRVPSQSENDALVGTSGTPSSTNEYVTNDDTATTSTISSVVRANASGLIDDSFLTSVTKFGGTGADGALSISSGVTTIDCLNASLVVKNYTSISITGTASLAFSNPGTNGTIIILKSQGAVTITSSTNPAIDLRAMGAQSASGYGVGLLAKRDGGNGGASAVPGAAIAGIYNIETTEGKFLNLYCGGAGGNGYTAVGSPGAGGKGAGALYIECAGNLNITSNINLTGSAGTTGSGSSGGNYEQDGGAGGGSRTNSGAGARTVNSNGAGSGGGGGGGVFICLYQGTLTASSGTYSITGGSGGGGAAAGGAGGNGFSLVEKNNVFV